MLEAALDALERGYWVLWSSSDNPKRPAYRYSRGDPAAMPPMKRPADARCDRWWGQPVRWEDGVCVMLRAGQYVLDGDTPEGAELVRSIGADTLRVTTERGCHAYFTVPEKPRLRQGAGVVAPGVDGKGVASTGNYTVAVWWLPGGVRRVEHDVPAQPLPQSWVDRLASNQPSMDASRMTPELRRMLAARPPLTDTQLRLISLDVRQVCGDLERLLREQPDSPWARKFWGAAKELGPYVAYGYPAQDVHDALYAIFQRCSTHDVDPKRIPQAIDNGIAAGLGPML